MTTLRDFLNSRRVSDDSWNLTGMGCDAGKYRVVPEDYHAFMKLFHDHVYRQRKPSHLLERHGKYTPLLIDLDFRYSVDTQDRIYDKQHIQQFLSSYAASLFHFFHYDYPLRFFVMLKPELLEEKGVVKDGIHILCGDITLSYEIVKTLRAYSLDKGVLKSFADRLNSDDDCFDFSVLQKNNWFMYGASKPEREAYIVDYCYIAHPDGSLIEAEWVESDEEFIQLFSLQMGHEVPTSLPLRQEVEDEWRMWESIALDRSRGIGKHVGKEKKQLKDMVDHNDMKSIVSNVSTNISKILKLNGFEWKVDGFDEGYKLSHNTKDCLVVAGVEHSAVGHSCVFVQRSHAILSCFSHSTKKLPKTKSDALWKLLANVEDIEEDDYDFVYQAKKSQFEVRNFRVLNPPGYMTQIDDTWVHYTRQQLIDMNSGLFLDEAKKERFIDWWLRDESIRTFSKVGYFVDAKECPATVFNTFNGFAGSALPFVESVDLQPILDHLHILCGHQEEAYEFVLDWFADILQRPGTLNGICLILKGKHGCGKDMFLSWFGTKIIGLQNYYKTARPHIDLFGAFNSSRKDIVFYHIEEGNDAVFKDVNLQQFKNYITDSYASIQIKQKNTTSADSLVKNYNRFAISTNHVIRCEMNERRFFGVEASSEMCKNHLYFRRLAETMESDAVVAGFYCFLMKRNIQQRNWCSLPQTAYMKEMVAISIPELYYFIQGFIDAWDGEGNDKIVVKASDFYYTYCDWHAQNGEEKMKSMTAFGKDMKNVKGVRRISDRDSNVYEIEKDGLEFLSFVL